MLFAADAASTQRVYAIVVALVVIGVLFAAVAVWLVRQTRVDRELLAPLERMSERGWRDQHPADRHRQLDDVRPAGAQPLSRSRQRPDVDAAALARQGPVPRSLDDLKSVRVRSESAPSGGAPPSTPASATNSERTVNSTGERPRPFAPPTGRAAEAAPPPPPGEAAAADAPVGR